MAEKVANSLRELRIILANEDISEKPFFTANTFSRCIREIDDMEKCAKAVNIDYFLVTKMASSIDKDLLDILFRGDPDKKVAASNLYMNFLESARLWVQT